MFKQLFIVSTLVASLAQAVPYAKSYGYAAGPVLAAPAGYASAAYGAGSFGLAGLGGGLGLGLGGAVLAGPAIAAGPALAAPAIAAGPALAVAAGPASVTALTAPAVVPAAVQSNHVVSTIDVPSGGVITPTTIDVGASQAPINMIFRSASSALSVQGVHQSAPGSIQESASQDEPHLLRHTVTKPVIQDVREVIVPMRRITQQVQPVQEQIETVVARGGSTGVASGGAVVAAAAPAAVAGGALVAGPAVAGGALVGAGPAVGLVGAGPAIAAGPAIGGALVGGPAYATGGALIGGGYGYGAGLVGKYGAIAAPVLAKKY